MSTHPNVILMAVFTPDGTTRKTAREIWTDCGADKDGEFKIGNHSFSTTIMESDYDESRQISANEGDIVFHDYLTYGYGETIEWGEVERRVGELRAWAEPLAQAHNCSVVIKLTANYW